MLLKLTNATKGRIGEGLILNTELVLSFFENKTEDGRDVVVAYGMNGNTWEVSESIADIMALVDSNK